MLGLMQVCSAAATTAVHGGLSERLFCTRIVESADHGQQQGEDGDRGPGQQRSRPPPGTPAGTPRGRSAAMIAVYSSSAGAMT